MQISFIEIDEIKIAYTEKNADGANTIFFIHGNSVSKNCWRKQLESDALKNCRLVAFDLPGHGDSGKAINYNETYSLKGFAEIAAKIVTALCNDKNYLLAGLSLGTNIIAEMLNYNLQPLGLVLAGPCVLSKNVPAEKIIKPNTHVSVVFTEDADIKDVKQYAGETSLSNAEEDLQFFMNSYKTTDKKVRSVISNSISSEDYSNEIELLQKRKALTLVIFGKDEKVVYTDYLDNAELPLWKNNIFKIPGASHLVNIDQPDIFNFLLKDFAEDIFK